MKIQLITFALIFPLAISAQRAKCLHPDGKEFVTKTGTIKSYMDSLGIDDTHEYSHKQTVLFFRGFSDTLAFAWADNPAQMKEALRLYNHSAYLKSYSFYIDLDMKLDKNLIDTSGIVRILGRPTSTAFEGTVWAYHNYDLRINFENDFAVKADKVYYNEMRKQGIAITDFSVDGGDYSTNISISVYNTSKKTIKYLSITFRAFNAVDDAIGTKTVRGVGPIYPNESGSYDFESVFFSKVLDHVKIVSMTIEYMDQTKKVFNTETIKKLRLD